LLHQAISKLHRPGSTVNARAQVGLIRWPAPPFFELIDPIAPQHRIECAVELANGQMLHEELVEFDPDDGHIGLQWAKPENIKRIEFDKFNSISLPLLCTYAPVGAALEAIGAAGLFADHVKPFTIKLAGGGRMRGNTLGFVKDKAGLFLFPVGGGDDDTRVSRCFVPAVQITELRIGDLLGNMLVDKEVISAEALMLALGRQSQLRQEKIGSFLTRRAILSAGQLTLALRAQEKQPNTRLGEILVEQKLITAEQLHEALSIQESHRGRNIGKILIDMGVVSMPLIQSALSDKLGTPYVDVRNFAIGPGALEAIDAAFAIRHQVLPLLRIENTLVVAIEDPLALDFAHDLRFKAGMSIDVVIANPLDLEARIAREYSSREGGSAEGGAVDAPVAADDIIGKLVNRIIIEAYAQGTSTIHVESNGDKGVTRVRLRKDGVLVDYLELPYARGDALISRIKGMAGLDMTQRGQPQQGKFHFDKHGLLPVELRVKIIPTDNDLEDVVLGIAGGIEPLPLDEVGFSAPDLDKLKRMIVHRYGLILVCGPAESGRTTTLHAMLREINRPGIKIWTAEDPIEVTQPGLRQVQVHAEHDWTFAAATRAFIGADPDVIMIGGMLDVATMKIGVEAALNGHLVLSTLETHSAVSSVIRLLDPSVGSLNCADAFIGVLSQRLAPRLCPNCSRPHVASEAEVSVLLGEYCTGTSLDAAAVEARWRKEFGQEGHLILREATGCAACRNGYRKRVLVYELLAGTPEIKRLIRTHGTVQQLLAAAQADGLQSLQQNAIENVLRGVLDLASARTVASD
jgi:type II secretory ATPase GspE/PulE/Tfp pilus assembly ATPase PilB-like protein